MKWLLFAVFAIANQTHYEQFQIQSDCCIHETTRNELISHMEGEGYTFYNSTLTVQNGTCTSLLYFEFSYPTYMPSHVPSKSPSQTPTHTPTSIQSDTNEPTPYLSYDLMSI
jgi:hypothetical protein